MTKYAARMATTAIGSSQFKDFCMHELSEMNLFPACKGKDIMKLPVLFQGRYLR